MKNFRKQNIYKFLLENKTIIKSLFISIKFIWNSRFTGLYPVFVPHLIFLDAHVWIKLTKYESDDLKYHFVNKKKQF